VEKWELQIYQKAGRISSYFDICSKILLSIWEYYPLIERIVHSMRTTVHKNGHGGWGIHPGMNFGKYMENELGGTATNHIWFVKKKRKLKKIAAGVIPQKGC